MKSLLLDSSIIIDFTRQKNKPDTILFQLLEEELSISMISHSELYSGKSIWANKTARNELEDILSGLKILPLLEPISELAGKIRSETPIALMDCIIAATAIYHQQQLVTLNIKDFEKVEGLDLYSF